MNKIVTWTALSLSALTLSACSVPRGAALSSDILTEQTETAPSYQVITVTRANVSDFHNWPVTGWSGNYTWLSNPRGPQSQVIRTGDRVTLTIWDSQENSLLTGPTSNQVTLPAIPVAANGSIFLPYAGDVSLRNLTQTEARTKVQDALVQISPSAQIQLSVDQGANNAADLVGGVAQPGSYPLPNRNTTVLNLIAAGGGIRDSLENPLVRLQRGGRSYEIRADKLMTQPSLNTTVRGGDKIIIQEDDRYFTALGATGREELVPFTRENLTAIETLSTVGGLSDTRADLKAVLVLRDYDKTQLIKQTPDTPYSPSGPLQEQVVFAFDLTSAEGLFAARKFQINPKDTVLGTETTLTSARTVLGVIGSAVGLGNALDRLAN